MSLKLIFFQEANIVGRHHGAKQLLSQANCPVIIFLFTWAPGPVQLQVKTSRKKRHPAFEELLSLLGVIVQYGLADIACTPPGQCQQSLSFALQPAAPDTGI